MVPPSHRKAIHALLTMSVAAFDQLAAAFTARRPTADADDSPEQDVSRQLMRQALPKGLRREDVAAVVDIVHDLSYWLATDERVDVDTVVASVREAGQEGGVLSKKPSVAKWHLFEKRLRTLLSNSGPVGLEARATALAEQAERRLCPDHCDITTEVRPLFLDAQSDEVHASLVEHTLKLAFHRNGKGAVDTFRVSLSEVDLDVLELLIVRAKSRGRNVRSFMRQADLPLIDTPGRGSNTHAGT